VANFHSSLGAITNLIIGLARGYKKEYNRQRKRHPESPAGWTASNLKDEMIESFKAHLGDYFSDHRKEQMALVIWEAIEKNFSEQK
jgi:hypothetical protein